MLRRICVVLLLMLSSIQAAARSDHWSLGLQAYDAGDYREAVDHFEKILKSDNRRGHVLFNLGNAYQKMGSNGSALGAYYAARVLMPRDPDLKANISFIEKGVTDQLDSRIDKPLWLRSFVWLESTNDREQFWLACSCFGFALFLLGLGLWASGVKAVAWSGAGVFVVLAVTFSSGMAVSRFLRPNWGAVSQSSVDVLAGPSASAIQLFKLKQGAPVMVEQRSGDWYEIRLSDGKKGWARSAAVSFYKIDRGLL